MPRNPYDTQVENLVVGDFDPALPFNEPAVDQIIRWSARESMVPISPDSIRRHSFPQAAYEETEAGRALVGYAAVTHIFSADVLELGGLVVAERARGRGVASTIVRAVVAQAKEHMDPGMIIAFSNQRSAATFLRLGGVRIEDANTLPPEVWKVCHICRFFDDAQAKHDPCCGRVFDITDVSDE